MSNRTRDIIVGLTAIGGILGVAALMFFFGYIPKILEPGYIVKIHFAQAGGLNASSRVILDGVDIGRITQLNLQAPPHRGVIMVAQIREQYNIPKEVEVTIASKLLGGSPALGFYTDKLSNEQMTQYLLKDGSAKLDGELQNMLDDLTAKMQQYMEPALAKLTQVADDFSRLSKQWEQVGANISELTAPRTPQQVDQGKAAANINTLIARADQRMAELKTAIDNINSIIGDKQLKADIQGMVNQATQTAKAIQQTATTAQQQAVKITQKIFAVADDLSATITSAKKTIDLAREGNGTVGKLLNDAKLYNNLNDAVGRLNKALDEATLLLQKVKAEGVNINL